MKIFRFLFSGTFMGMLLIVFGMSIGYATIVENNFDAAAAKLLVYNARWFEILMLLMVINFCGMIFTKKLYVKEKLNILVIHISLIIIIIGAGITRYIGYEGQMRIREGETSNSFMSADNFISVRLDIEGGKTENTDKVLLTPYKANLYNERYTIGDKKIDVVLDTYLPNAMEQLVEDENGATTLSLVVATPTGRKDINLQPGETRVIGDLGIAFDSDVPENYLKFSLINDTLYVIPPLNSVDTAANHELTEGEPSRVSRMRVYKIFDTQLLVKDFLRNARYEYVPVTSEEHGGVKVAKILLKGGDETREFWVKSGVWEHTKINGVDVSVIFGNQTWSLPFALRLEDFVLDRYPGSMSPSSFASEITLIDEKNQLEKPYRIFMNNVLNYQGFRFYQSSYDQDEKGTILSVNHDRWGTIVTYFGYFLLFLTLIISFFTKNTRYSRVSRQIAEVHAQRKKLLGMLVLGALILGTGNAAQAQQNGIYDKKHAAEFGKLLVQEKGGRMMPVNTLSNQLVVKLYKKSAYKDLSADQVMLGMMMSPEVWQNEQMIKVTHPTLQKRLKLEGEHACFNDFFDENRNYIFKDEIDEAYAKKPALRNTLEKELIYLDERINVAYLTYTGSILKIFPIPDHPEDKWISLSDFDMLSQNPDALKIQGMFRNYMQSLESGDYLTAGEALKEMKEYQKSVGASIVPQDTKVNLEVLYNNMGIFKRLFPVYMMLGMILFGFFFAQIFKPALQFRLIIKILVGILAVAFILQTIGLGIRWYIAGHAPWSNGYESMIYISWATMLAGFMYMRRTPIIISVTSLLTGVTLLTAHMSWMNPEITNLVPVLQSYWLTFHVATITASYGFLALGSMTGFLNLLIMIFRNKGNRDRVNLTLKELTLIIELSLTVGLILLVIGNFLGGIWANESWGRYWGWDPKETWSLVTIIVYSFILHMRLIPGLRSTFSFNFFTMFAFSSVLMTYFGVNYYLSGLHSYASGDPVPVPTFVYYSLAIMFGVSILAAINDVRMKSGSEDKTLDTES